MASCLAHWLWSPLLISLALLPPGLLSSCPRDVFSSQGFLGPCAPHQLLAGSVGGCSMAGLAS